MTQSSERLDRIEAILEGLAVSLARTESIVQSNARAIEAEQTEARQHRQHMHQAIRDLMSRNFENLNQHQEFREALAEWDSRLGAMSEAIASLAKTIESWIQRRGGDEA